MQIVYRYNRPRAFHAASLTVTDSLLTAVLTPTTTDEGFKGEGEPPLIPGNPVTLTLSLGELKAISEFDDGAMLSFDAMELKPGIAIKWKNLYLGTMLGRRPMLDYLHELGWNTAFRILVPAGGITSMRQCKYIVQMHDESGVIECADPITTLATPHGFTALQFRPRIIGTTSADVTSPSVQLSIQLEDSDGEHIAASGTVFLETTAGTLSRPRVVLNEQGVGTFELFTAGVQPGETVKIKAGFRYFPGAEDHLVEFAA